MSKPFSLTYVIYNQTDPLGPILAILSLAPPFCVASLTLHTLLTRDLRGAFLLSGLVATAFLCTILKQIINQPRPVHANLHVSEYLLPDGQQGGMPSNHAAFVSFCAVFSMYFAMTQYKHYQTQTTTTTKSCYLRWIKRWVPAIGAIVIAAGCSYSRVHLGYHTINQVLVGTLLGSTMGGIYAVFYDGVYRNRIAPWVEQSWLGRDWDVRSYHDYYLEEEGDDVASFMARCLDDCRRRRVAANEGKRGLETDTKMKTT